jgi:hypothetical protein
MQNLANDHGENKSRCGNSNNDCDAVLTLEGLVASSRDLVDDQKLDLLQFLAGLRGRAPSRDALRFALRIGKEEGVW